MCTNGGYREHGIKALHGFARESYRAPAEALVKLDTGLGELGVLVEPTSVVAKAWEQVDRVGGRAAAWDPQVALVTGAGPIGLLAALLASQRGLQVHVVDLLTTGRKPALVEELGARYHTGSLSELDICPDVIIECTGVGDVIGAVLGRARANGVVCMAGVSSIGHPIPLDLGRVNREWVLGNEAVVGSVNANRRHYEAAADALALAPKQWLTQLITRRMALTDAAEAFRPRADDIKSILMLAEP
jgi:threonine dehydrogenase-like Zn-dependent dehydrogenase